MPRVAELSFNASDSASDGCLIQEFSLCFYIKSGPRSAMHRRELARTLHTVSTPRPIDPQIATRPSPLRRVLRFVVPFRRLIVVLSSVTLLVAALNAAEPLVLKHIFDELAGSRQSAALGWGIGVLAALGIARELASAGAHWLTWKCRLGLHYALLEALVEHLHRLPLTFHRRTGVGAIMTKLDRGVQGFLTAVTELLINVFPAVLYLCISVVVMFKLNTTLATVVLCFAPIPAIIAACASPEQTRRERRLLDRWVHIYSRFNEVLAGILTVRSFSME